MIEQVRQILIEKCRVTKDAPIIVGVSGGADSLCLMTLLHNEGYRLVVGHFDHQMRENSHQDAVFVSQVAARFGLEFISGQGDVPLHAHNQGMSAEEAARDLRYRFLFGLARQYHAQAVAVGHHADDQVETVLLHLIRGSGLGGLRGMSYRSMVRAFDAGIPIIRPLLDVRREEIAEFCADRQLIPLEDATNNSVQYQRNRIRHELLPQLRTYNPSVDEAVLRLSRLAADDNDLIRQIIQTHWVELEPDHGPGFISFAAGKFLAQPTVMQRHLFRNAVEVFDPLVELSSQAIELATEYLRSAQNGGHADVKGGLKIWVEADRVYLSRSVEDLPSEFWPQVDGESILVIPGRLMLSNGWVLESRCAENFSLVDCSTNPDPFQAWVDADKIANGIILRTRLNGDVIAPLGMGGRTQKLSDLMVNEKMPQRARSHWPLLCCGGEILWVPGYRLSHSFQISLETRRAVHFHLKREE